jgi:Protein of unknown function (DUF3562)
MTRIDISEVVHAIAAETETPAETVKEIYDRTQRQLSDGARVQDYVAVFTARRVREILRDQAAQQPASLPEESRVPAPQSATT